MKADQIETVEGARVWAVHHETSDELVQGELRKDVDDAARRLATIERRVLFAAGAASALGALAGGQLPGLF